MGDLSSGYETGGERDWNRDRHPGDPMVIDQGELVGNLESLSMSPGADSYC